MYLALTHPHTLQRNPPPNLSFNPHAHASLKTLHGLRADQPQIQVELSLVFSPKE